MLDELYNSYVIFTALPALTPAMQISIHPFMCQVIQGSVNTNKRFVQRFALKPVGEKKGKLTYMNLVIQ